MWINLLAVVVAASVWLLAAPGAMAQTLADPARLRWQVPPVLPPGAAPETGRPPSSTRSRPAARSASATASAATRRTAGAERATSPLAPRSGTATAGHTT
jgi:hypothetical protein